MKGTTQSEKRVSVIGTMGSGKTTALGLMCLTCETLSAYQPNFKSRIKEHTSGIRQAPSDLRRGHFPPKTLPGAAYEADLVLKQEGRFGTRIVRLPFCETAGEDIQKWISRFSGGMYSQRHDYRVLSELYKYVLSSNGFILVCPTSRALMYTDSTGMEKEPDDLPVDPDVNLVRILEAMYDYKDQTKMTPIEGMAVLLTKYDMVREDTQHLGMDLSTVAGMQQFMNSFFPQTSQALKYYGMDKVRFFPSFVQVQRDQNDPRRFVKWPDGSDKILMNMHRPRMPQYSEQSYMDLINWLIETFAE